MNLGSKCKKCKKGKYIEKTLMDSFHGVLTCNKCGDVIDIMYKEPIKRIETTYTDEELKSFGWAPGGYYFNCSICKNQGDGDKRCFSCFNCAVKSKDTYEANSLIPEVVELRKQNEKYRKVLREIRGTLGEEFYE